MSGVRTSHRRRDRCSLHRGARADRRDSRAPVAAGNAPPSAVPPSRYAPVSRYRLADTRAAVCGCTPVDAATIPVEIAGREGVPAGSRLPPSPSPPRDVRHRLRHRLSGRHAAPGDVDPQHSGRAATRANSGIVPLGATARSSCTRTWPRRPDRRHHRRVHVATTAVSAGRFVPVDATPAARHASRAARRSPAGGELTVAAAGRRRPPMPPRSPSTSRASASRRRVLQRRPAGSPPGRTLVHEPRRQWRPRAAQVIVPVSPGGFTIATTSGGHVIVDLVGWFTGPSAPPTRPSGCSCRPRRPASLDTRRDQPRAWRGGTVELGLPDPRRGGDRHERHAHPHGRGGVRHGVPCRHRPADDVELNADDSGRHGANLAITRAQQRGTAYFSDPGTDLVVDITGYFTGTPVAVAAAGATERPSTVAGADRRRLDARRRAVHPRLAGAMSGFDRSSTPNRAAAWCARRA